MYFSMCLKLIQKNFGLNESIGPKDNTTTDNKTRKIKYLRQKMTDLEKKFKIEELNYKESTDDFTQCGTGIPNTLRIKKSRIVLIILSFLITC